MNKLATRNRIKYNKECHVKCCKLYCCCRKRATTAMIL